MKNIILIIISLILTGFVWLFSIPIIVINVPQDGALSVDAILGYVFTLIGALPLAFLLARLVYRKKISKISRLLEQEQSIKPVPLAIFAQALNTSERKIAETIQEMIYFGYTRRIVIDYSNNNIIYLDSTNIDKGANSNFAFIKCDACGATNKALKGTAYTCAYCGKAHQDFSSRENVILSSTETFNDAESKSLKENLKLGCITPLLIVPFFITLSSIIAPLRGSDNLFDWSTIIALVLNIGLYFVWRNFLAAYYRKKPNPDALQVLGITYIIGGLLLVVVNAVIGAIFGFVGFLAMAYIIMVPIPLLIGSYLLIRHMYLIVNKKYLRAAMARYMAVLVETRNPNGVDISHIAAILKEPQNKVLFNLKLLIKHKYLPGVNLIGKPPKVHYMDDDKLFDRFAEATCNQCGGQSVATYGKANNCPYCGNDLPIS